VHGWLLFEQDKMSKSRGKHRAAETILDVLGVDALRYFRCAKLSSSRWQFFVRRVG